MSRKHLQNSVRYYKKKICNAYIKANLIEKKRLNKLLQDLKITSGHRYYKTLCSRQELANLVSDKILEEDIRRYKKIWNKMKYLIKKYDLKHLL